MSETPFVPNVRAATSQDAAFLQVDAVELALRGLAGFLTTEHHVRALRSVQRRHIESYKMWLAAQPAGPKQDDVAAHGAPRGPQ